jgi:hypothetical protein
MDLIAELQREFGSHLSAELNEWSFAADFGEVMAVIHAEAFINSNRDQKLHPDPFALPKPWGDKAAKADVTPEERAALRAQLLRYSAFAN